MSSRIFNNDHYTLYFKEIFNMFNYLDAIIARNTCSRIISRQI